MKKVQNLVIGSGPGGYEAALHLKHLGASEVVLIEKDNLGGVCTNWGCIPTKAMVSVVEKLEAAEEAEKYGLKIEAEDLDFSKVQKYQRRIARTMSLGVKKLLKDAGVEVITGEAFLEENRIIAVTHKEEKKEIQAEKVIIATGSHPFFPPNMKRGQRILNSKDLLGLSVFPSKLLVIGGGVIGCEFASIYRRLGAEVTVVEMMPRLLPMEDEEASALIQQELQKAGIDFLLSAKVSQLEEKEESVVVTYSYEGGEATKEVTHVLVSVGRRPSVQNLGLENWGIEYSPKGISVDEKMKTNMPEVYAIGDVTGKSLLAHTASRQAEVAAENIMGKASQMSYDAIPSAIFTIPQVASVGLKEAGAREKFGEIKVGKASFMSNGKARAMGIRSGFIKIIATAQDKIVGAHLVGPEVTELVAPLTLAVTNKLTLKSFIHTIHAHPTLSETIKQAVKDIY